MPTKLQEVEDIKLKTAVRNQYKPKQDGLQRLDKNIFHKTILKLWTQNEGYIWAWLIGK